MRGPFSKWMCDQKLCYTKLILKFSENWQNYSGMRKISWAFLHNARLRRAGCTKTWWSGFTPRWRMNPEAIIITVVLRRPRHVVISFITLESLYFIQDIPQQKSLKYYCHHNKRRIFNSPWHRIWNQTSITKSLESHAMPVTTNWKRHIVNWPSR